jgi:cyclophilin family peptidyl-prolyl cis-trans isomerase
MKTTLFSIALATAALLSACGGGGGDAGGPPPTISTATVTSSARYSDNLSFTLVGTNLDQNLNFVSGGCRGFTRLTAAPTQSTSTVAYYTCTVSGVGAQTIAVSSSALPGTLATMNFSVETPQVTLSIVNGAAVAGSMVITLRPDLTPATVDNFLAYVKSGFYNNTVFHRHGRSGTATAVTGEFVLQGGGYAAPLSSGSVFPAPKATNAPIALETGLSNLRYTVAMARTNVLNSATSLFFINTVDNAFLDTSGGGYAAFGTITTGTTLVDAMVSAPCSFSAANFGLNSPDCLPEPNLVIVSAQQTR